MRKRIDHVFGMMRDPLLQSDSELDRRFAYLAEKIIEHPEHSQRLQYAQAQILAAKALKKIMREAKHWP